MQGLVQGIWLAHTLPRNQTVGGGGGGGILSGSAIQSRDPSAVVLINASSKFALNMQEALPDRQTYPYSLNDIALLLCTQMVSGMHAYIGCRIHD